MSSLVPPLTRSMSSESVESMMDVAAEASRHENIIEFAKKELNRLKPLMRGATEAEVVQNFEAFMKLFKQYVERADGKISWSSINPPPKGTILPHKELSKPSKDIVKAQLSKLCVIKLNGGLGTSMGCVGPKSAITVRSDQTFLDLCVRSIECLHEEHGVPVPLVLMNSFNTHADTLKILKKYQHTVCKPRTFNQSRFPRIHADSQMPLPQDDSNNSEWYPPGHGDLYKSLYQSGELQRLIDEGIEYAFVSNIDNLGATVDESILGYLHEHPECEFVMEVTDKTRADVKGGTLIEYDGKLRLLEIAQVPKDHVDEFKSITKFRIFNTNNLWLKLSAIKRLVEAEAMHMEIIENKKTTDDGTKVIQLEQAVGSAIKNFDNAIGINVPRSRFLPVKKTQDLLLAMSNLYIIRKGTLVMNPKRVFQDVPLVKLGDLNFKKVHQFLGRFEKIPDMLELDHLTVTGDVYFTGRVTLKGTVIIIANHGDRIDIPAGTVLENKIVSGNLRILDH